jgi:hypothetical protein
MFAGPPAALGKMSIISRQIGRKGVRLDGTTYAGRQGQMPAYVPLFEH